MTLMTSLELKERIVEILEDKKAQDIKVLDLKNKTSISDFFVIASGTSSRHLVGISQFIREALKKQTTIHIEGSNQCDWVLVDGGDVIVHLFMPEIRQLYNLESMWRDVVV